MSKPIIMGAINVTPDSFSDGGECFEHQHAIERGLAMAEQGADMLDIGGESTRPGAKPISVEEELRRVIPVVVTLAEQIEIPISIDTSQPEVMRQAIEAGASMINDVRSFKIPGAIDAVKNANVGVCIMHMPHTPEEMKFTHDYVGTPNTPEYNDVLEDINHFLKTRVDELVSAGIARSRIWVDPGFCFGKTLDHNLTMLQNVDHFCELGLPVLAGVSRKSFIGHVLDKEPSERLYGTIASVVYAQTKGINIFRVHDVAPIHDALTFTHRVIHQGAS